MKKTLIAMAAIAAMGAASAQTTNTMYGLVDLFAQSNNNGSTSTTSVGSGGYSTSRLGIKGETNLGDGLKAIGMMEASVDASNPSATTLGNRGASVGVAGSFGTVSLCNQFTGYAMSFFNDATEYDGFSPVWVGNFNYGYAPGTKSIHTDRVWQGHSLQYTSPTVNGFNVNVMVAPGGNSAGAVAANTTYAIDNDKTSQTFGQVVGNKAVAARGADMYTSVGVNLAISGLAFALGWETDNVGATGVTTSASNLSVAGKAGAASLYLGVNTASNGKNKENGYMVTAAVPLSGTWSVQGGYAASTTDLATELKVTGTTAVLLNDMNKQTRAYVGVKQQAVSGSDNSTSVLAGVRYSF